MSKDCRISRTAGGHATSRGEEEVPGEGSYFSLDDHRKTGLFGAVMEDDQHIYLPTDRFSRRLQEVKEQDPQGYQRIRAVIDRLLQHPEEADGKMHGLYQGRFKKYVGRRDYRLIYYWCALCRKENRRREKQCGNCEAIPDNSVIFFDLYHKNESKKIRSHLNG